MTNGKEKKMNVGKGMEGTVRGCMDGAVLSIIGSSGFWQKIPTMSLVFLLLVFLHMASGLIRK